MKEIGWEFPFIKDVLSSQVALVIRELGQDLTDYISASFFIRCDIKSARKCAKTERLGTISAPETTNGKFKI
jgi:hypothetical protein